MKEAEQGQDEGGLTRTTLTGHTNKGTPVNRLVHVMESNHSMVGAPEEVALDLQGRVSRVKKGESSQLNRPRDHLGSAQLSQFIKFKM